MDHLVHAPNLGRDQDQLLWRKVEELCSGQPWSSLPPDAVSAKSPSFSVTCGCPGLGDMPVMLSSPKGQQH